MTKEYTTVAKTASLTLTKESFVHSKSGKLYESVYLWSDVLNRNVFFKVEEKNITCELMKSLEYYINKNQELEKELSEIKRKIEMFALSFGFEEYPNEDKAFIASYR